MSRAGPGPALSVPLEAANYIQNYWTDLLGKIVVEFDLKLGLRGHM